MSKKSKSKYKSKYKKLLSRLDKVINHAEDKQVMLMKGCSPKIKNHIREYNIDMENSIINYLDLLIEHINIPNNVKINLNDDYINITGHITTTTSNGNYLSEEYFDISFNTKDKYISLHGSIVNDEEIRMKYEKLESHIDKINELKNVIDLNNFKNNFEKVYHISGLAREKSLQDLDIKD